MPKRRWGQANPDQTTITVDSASPAHTAASQVIVNNGMQKSLLVSAPLDDAKMKVLAMKESIRERLAAAKAKQQEMNDSTLHVSTDFGSSKVTTQQHPQFHSNQSKRAKTFELDLSITTPTYSTDRKLPILRAETEVTKPTAKVSNPYLVHLQKEVITDSKNLGSKDNDTSGTLKNTLAVTVDDATDERLERAGKVRKRHKALTFVEPGHWLQVAEQKRQLAAKAEASGYVSGRKSGHTIQSAHMGQIYGRGDDDDGIEDELDTFEVLDPRADARTDTKVPLVLEWWDVPLLPGKLKKQVAAVEANALTKQTKAALQNLGNVHQAEKDNQSQTTATGNVSQDTNQFSEELSPTSDLYQQCFEQASLSCCKTAGLVQHIVPVKPAHVDKGPPKPPVMHLTKKERKRQRKLRRQEKQRELQDMQAAGLTPAPEPRLTLKNFIQVLGDQAFLDPSQMEQKVLDQMQKRQQAHLERNEANKLSKEQRAEKRGRKLQEDTSCSVSVAIFYVKDMSHPYHRAKVDLNAQQNNISGGVLECQNPALACVICEGGPKAVKRFSRLMEVRMKWTGPDDGVYEDDEEEVVMNGDEENTVHKFNPLNKCELVWQGIAVKRLFKNFIFQACETSDQARKVLKQKGVPQYWDQVLEHAKGRSNSLQLKLSTNNSEVE